MSVIRYGVCAIALFAASMISAHGQTGDDASGAGLRDDRARIVRVEARWRDTPEPSYGQGLIETLNDQCFVLTPLHVVTEEIPGERVPHTADEIVVFGQRTDVTATARQLERIPLRLTSEEIAVLDILDDRNGLCAPSAETRTSVGSDPGRWLVSRDRDGALVQVSASLRRDPYPLVELALEQRNLEIVQRGWSGSGLFHNENLRGVVVSRFVDGSPVGDVLAIDYREIEALLVRTVIRPRVRPQGPADPAYPRAALLEGRSGEVSVRFDLDAQGQIIDARAVAPSDPVFEAAAVEAVGRMVFAPVRRNGAAVRIDGLEETVRFAVDFEVQAVPPQTLYTSEKTILRAGPGARFDRVAGLPLGADLTVDGRSGSWRRVTTPGGARGFVEADVLVAEKPGPTVGEVFRDCPACPEMVVVPAGDFWMGSEPGAPDWDNQSDERPRRKVTFDQPFAVGRTEVTFDQWDACVADGGCQGPESTTEGTAHDEGWGRGDRPVINVDWEDAKAYAGWLSRKMGRTYRLLTEAEWEYAARAGTQTRYFWGNEIGRNNANCGGCGSEWDYKQTAPVKSFQANAWGLYDMHGNVWEWVEDCWHGSYADGTAWMAANEGDCTRAVVVRGGSSDSYPRHLRSANRSNRDRDRRDDNIGFRLARTL